MWAVIWLRMWILGQMGPMVPMGPIGPMEPKLAILWNCALIFVSKRLQWPVRATSDPCWSGKSCSWPHLNPIFPYFFIGFLTIIYKKPYKKQWFLIQFAKLDRFPPSTQNFKKNLFGHFRPFFAIISFFWSFQIKDPPQNINFHPTKNSRSPFFASKLHFFCPTSTTHFFQFCGFPDLRNSV